MVKDKTAAKAKTQRWNSSGIFPMQEQELQLMIYNQVTFKKNKSTEHCKNQIAWKFEIQV